MIYDPLPIGKTCRKCGVWKPAPLMRPNKHNKLRIDTICRNCFREWTRAYDATRKEINREHTRKYDSTHRELRCEHARLRRLANLEQFREKDRKFHADHKSQENQQSREWRKAHPDAVREHRRKRRAKLLKSNGIFTQADFELLKAKYGFQCLCCGQTEPSIRLVPDHVLPLAKGGRNDIGNIQPLCVNCNAVKHVKHIDYRPGSTGKPVTLRLPGF